VKLAPVNQTFIPAGLPVRQASALVLKRLTVVPSNSEDDVLVVQADYADSPDSNRMSFGRLAPVEQYARIQKDSGVTSAQPLLDVRA
jgi:hypothetical protein